MVNQTALLSTNPSILNSNNNTNTIYSNDSKIDECSAMINFQSDNTNFDLYSYKLFFLQKS